MRPPVAICACCLLLLGVPARAQTNVIFGTLTSATQSPRTNVTVSLITRTPVNRNYNAGQVSVDPVPQNTDTNGFYAFTNVIWGKYLIQFSDSSGTAMTIYVGTNTLGPWPIGALATNAAALPANPATNYYTISQAQAILSSIPVGSGNPLWFGSSFYGLYPSGTVGSDTNWVSNGSIIYPQ